MPKLRLLLVCIAILFAQSGCLYFNLFYNAESAFDTGCKAQQKYLKTNPDSSNAIAPESQTSFKRCVDKCKLVFEIYPKAIKWHDRTLFLMGKAYLYEGEYDLAILTFQRMQKVYPASSLIPQSYTFLGKAYLKNGNLAEAENVFSLISTKYPFLNKDHEIDILKADLAIYREGKAQAIEMLEASYKSLKTDDKRMELAIKIARLYADLKLYQKAINTLEKSPRVKQFSDLLYRIDFLRIVCYIEISQWVRAQEIIAPMLTTKTYVSHVPDLLLKKAEIFDKTNSVDPAISLFNQITETYASSDAAAMAWFEVARIYQVKKCNLTKAKECYDKAATSLKDESLKNLAQLRSKAIETILKLVADKNFKDTVTADSITPVKYKIGELFWLELDQPDSAYKYFCLMSKDTLHKKLMPKALYSAAWIARYSLLDSLKADSLYKILVARYPTNLYAQKAQEARGGPITIVTRLDSAANAFHNAEQLFYEDNTPELAADAYVVVYQMFPETDYGPKSLFAAAWINDFILDKNRSAKKLYELLCDSFPKSSYCLNEAKPRIKTVMDTLAVYKALKKLPARENKSPDPKPVVQPQTNSDNKTIPLHDTTKQNAPDTLSSVNTIQNTPIKKPISPPKQEIQNTQQPSPIEQDSSTGNRSNQEIEVPRGRTSSEPDTVQDASVK